MYAVHANARYLPHFCLTRFLFWNFLFDSIFGAPKCNQICKFSVVHQFNIESKFGNIIFDEIQHAKSFRPNLLLCLCKWSLDFQIMFFFNYLRLWSSIFDVHLMSTLLYICMFVNGLCLILFEMIRHSDFANSFIYKRPNKLHSFFAKNKFNFFLFFWWLKISTFILLDWVTISSSWTNLVPFWSSFTGNHFQKLQ